MNVVVISFLVFEFDFFAGIALSVNYSEKSMVNCQHIFDDWYHFLNFGPFDLLLGDFYRLGLFSNSLLDNHFSYYILVIEF